MNIDVIYNKIIEKLKVSNALNEISSLEKSAKGASTGSEALMQQGAYLLSLRQVNPSVFKLIEAQVQEYLMYCKLNGLVIS